MQHSRRPSKRGSSLYRGILPLLAALSVMGCGDDAIGTSDDAYLRQVVPCDRGSCWDTSASLESCGIAVHDEDFSSGRFNVHRYAIRIPGGATTRIVLARLEGTWRPTLVVADRSGRVLFDGEQGVDSPSFATRAVPRDGDGSVTEVVLSSDAARDVDVFVTGRDVVASGFVESMPTEADYNLVLEDDCVDLDAERNIAPSGVVAGEELADAGNHGVAIGIADWGPAQRFDVPAGTHAGFRLSAGGSSVDMQVLQWTGEAVEEMVVTSGAGERAISVLDAIADRTYWVRGRGVAVPGRLVATFLPFREGADCEHDCGRLMQLPLPNDASFDGYAPVEGAVLRYQYGRRDVLMSVRHAGREVIAQGLQPFTVEDLSKASGAKPPGHASHTAGKDIDLSVYDASGAAVWHPLCDEVGDECIAGTDAGMDVEAMALKIAALLDGERVTHVFLDREFHGSLFAAADALVTAGRMRSSRASYLRSVVSHWPNHNNHIHVRYAVSP